LRLQKIIYEPNSLTQEQNCVNYNSFYKNVVKIREIKLQVGIEKWHLDFAFFDII